MGTTIPINNGGINKGYFTPYNGDTTDYYVFRSENLYSLRNNINTARNEWNSKKATLSGILESLTATDNGWKGNSANAVNSRMAIHSLIIAAIDSIFNELEAKAADYYSRYIAIDSDAHAYARKVDLEKISDTLKDTADSVDYINDQAKGACQNVDYDCSDVEAAAYYQSIGGIGDIANHLRQTSQDIKAYLDALLTVEEDIKPSLTNLEETMAAALDLAVDSYGNDIFNYNPFTSGTYQIIKDFFSAFKKSFSDMEEIEGRSANIYLNLKKIDDQRSKEYNGRQTACTGFSILNTASSICFGLGTGGNPVIAAVTGFGHGSLSQIISTIAEDETVYSNDYHFFTQSVDWGKVLKDGAIDAALSLFSSGFSQIPMTGSESKAWQKVLESWYKNVVISATTEAAHGSYSDLWVEGHYDADGRYIEGHIDEGKAWDLFNKIVVIGLAKSAVKVKVKQKTDGYIKDYKEDQIAKGLVDVSDMDSEGTMSFKLAASNTLSESMQNLITGIMKDTSTVFTEDLDKLRNNEIGWDEYINRALDNLQKAYSKELQEAPLKAAESFFKNSISGALYSQAIRNEDFLADEVILRTDTDDLHRDALEKAQEKAKEDEKEYIGNPGSGGGKTTWYILNNLDDAKYESTESTDVYSQSTDALYERMSNLAAEFSLELSVSPRERSSVRHSSGGYRGGGRSSGKDG